MVAQLIYSRITGSIIPVDSEGKPLPLLAAKLAEGKPLLIKEMESVHGFMQLLQIVSKKVATERKLYLALQIVLVKNGRHLSKIELIDSYSHKMDIVSKSVLPVPRLNSSPLGSWEVLIGYCAIYDDELIPNFVNQILESLPYSEYEGNHFKFEVIEKNEGVKPNGEWARRSDASEMATTGRFRPDEI